MPRWVSGDVHRRLLWINATKLYLEAIGKIAPITNVFTRDQFATACEHKRMPSLIWQNGECLGEHS